MLQIRSYGYTPQLGWSVSRYDAFTTCRRQYFYLYYAKHDLEHPPETIRALRELTCVPLETGNVVHSVLAAIVGRLLRSRDGIDRGRFEQFVHRQVEQAVRQRRFSEVHYGEQEAVQVQDLLPAVQECLDAFLGSPRYAWIRDEALRLGWGNEWLIEPDGYGECRIDGMKAYCKVDFAFLVGQRLSILDWKTGRRDEAKHRRQLVAYATWAVHDQGVAPGQVEAVVAYLRPEYAEVPLQPSAAEVDGFVACMRAQTEELRALCADADQNRPLPKEAFAMTEMGAICRHCNFRQLCGRA
ncbi:MAG: PD-(D/E)XK nuclease family protein [Candidatus Latescibacterota bacterium]